MSARAEVRIYVTSWCPYCARAKQLLQSKGVSFTEIDVDGRQDLRGWLLSATGQRTVPQVFVNGQPLGGFSDIDALDEEGRLDLLLAEAPRPGAAALPG
jgi:glutaredoxin 3